MSEIEIVLRLIQQATDWSNANQGALTLALFALTLFLGWISGIFAAARRKPRLNIQLLPGPTFACTFGTGDKHEDYDVHRTGIALYLKVANVGSASANLEDIYVCYHWAIRPLGLFWWKYRVGWYCLTDQSVALQDFQVNIGERVKVYPFLFQKSAILGKSSESYLLPGQSTLGVVYFEQTDSYGACFPLSKNNMSRMKVKIKDSFGRVYVKRFYIPKLKLSEAQKYNPSFGRTLASLHGTGEPIELAADENGNLFPPSGGEKARHTGEGSPVVH